MIRTQELAQRVLALQTDPSIEARMKVLATKANEGQLSVEERAEYENFVEAFDLISILQARARAILDKRTGD